MTDDRMKDDDVGSLTRLALNVLAHKRTLLILPPRSGARTAAVHPAAFDGPGVTSQVLAESLRDLERDGIVNRREHSAVPPHVEYSLTDPGASLFEPARAIRAWAEQNGPAVIAARQRYAEGNGSQSSR